MKSYQEGAFYYGNSKGTITTDYQRKRLKSTGDVYALLKESFKDLLQELLEAELDVSMGYDKNNKGDMDTDNKRNGYSPKTVESEFGEFQLDILRDCKGEFEPEIKEQQSRPLEPIYPFVFMDAIHYKMREDGRILNRATYVILGQEISLCN